MQGALGACVHQKKAERKAKSMEPVIKRKLNAEEEKKFKEKKVRATLLVKSSIDLKKKPSGKTEAQN